MFDINEDGGSGDFMEQLCCLLTLNYNGLYGNGLAKTGPYAAIGVIKELGGPNGKDDLPARSMTWSES